MLSGDIHFLLRKQQYKEALQRSADERLVRASQEVFNKRKLYLRAMHWTGRQMLKWGNKLEQWDTRRLDRVLTSTEG